MRTESEMLHLILSTAWEDDRILAVYTNGSRNNKNVPKDIFQDYDVVYVVTETESFRQQKDWIDRFGKRLYMQYPEDNSLLMNHSADIDNCYGWLIQLADGNRLDLHVQTVEYSVRELKYDRLSKILLDKTGSLPKIPQPSDADYIVKKPKEGEFAGICNNFWWCLNNVAKGLWREEIPYVQDMINYWIRTALISVLSWKIGLETNFTVSIGKSGKYLKNYLSNEEYQRFLQTYASYEIEEIWNSVMVMCELFDETAKQVAGKLDFTYNQEEAQASISHLKHVRILPKDAAEIYEGK